jgi:peptide deformylase
MPTRVYLLKSKIKIKYKHMMPVLIFPNKNLRLKSKELSADEIKSSTIQNLIGEMSETMLKKDGIGLAAPQVDQPIRLIVINTEGGPQEFINPKIVKKSWAKNIMEEGCLSVPGVFGLIKRPKKIKVEYLDRAGAKHSLIDDRILARVLQHEIDHLDGILFIDKVIRITQGEEKMKEISN